jgi:predicted nuclease of predicted toxin-antitoxin system
MKLLFDQNISYRIVSLVSNKYPEAKHINQVGLEDATDNSIWNFAKEYDYTIVTFDSDYYDLSIIRGCPPKIIWLRIGNTSTKMVAKVLIDDFALIKAFHKDPSYQDLACLEIG